jgi:hypothetical protein
MNMNVDEAEQLRLQEQLALVQEQLDLMEEEDDALRDQDQWQELVAREAELLDALGVPEEDDRRRKVQ